MSQWQQFARLVGDENRLLAELNVAALQLTDTLVRNDPAAIEAAERRLEAQRVLHGTAYAQRIAMQRAGFGNLTMEQVCAYAPASLRRWLHGTVHQLGTRGTELRLTVSNNKALILAGLERLARHRRRAAARRHRTARHLSRRGTVPPPAGKCHS